jgi:hypothetical protein
MDPAPGVRVDDRMNQRQEAKEELKARGEEKEAEELEQALFNELKPIFARKS